MVSTNQHSRWAAVRPWLTSVTALGAVTGMVAIFFRYLPWDFDVAWALEMSLYGLAAGVVLGAGLGLLVGIGAAAHHSTIQSATSHLRFVRAWGLFVCVTVAATLLAFGGGPRGIGGEPGQVAGTALSMAILLTAVGAAYRRAPQVVARYLRRQQVAAATAPAEARHAVLAGGPSE